MDQCLDLTLDDGDPCSLVEGGLDQFEGSLHGPSLLPGDDECQRLAAAVTDPEAGQEVVEEPAAGGQLQAGQPAHRVTVTRHIDVDKVFWHSVVS